MKTHLNVNSSQCALQKKHDVKTSKMEGVCKRNHTNTGWREGMHEVNDEKRKQLDPENQKPVKETSR